MMNKKQTTTTLALVSMAILTTVMTTTINYVTPASALGHFEEPNGLADFSGISTSDKTSEFDGLLDKDHRSGYDTFLDGTSGALSGFPDEEMNAASTPEQPSGDIGRDSPTEGGEAATTGNDSGGGSMDSETEGYEEFQGCLSEIEVNGSPTEQQVHECMELSYGEMDSSENTPMKSIDGGDEDEDGITEHVSNEDGEDGEDREDRDSEE
jgi:hypothetical protein